jgi:hypothetical protein
MQDGTTEAVIEEKKKSPVILLLAAVGSIAVAGGVAYWQFGGHADQRSALDMAASNTVSKSGFAAMTPSKPVAPPAAEASSALPVAPKTGFGSAAPAAPADASGNLPVAQSGSATPQTETAALPPSAAMMAAPAPDAPVMAVKNLPAPQFPAVPGPATASTAVTDDRFNALSSRIDDLQKSLGIAAQQLNQISDRLAKAPTGAMAAAPAPGGTDQQTSDRIGRLEQKLAQLEEHQASGRPVAAAEYKPDDNASIMQEPVKTGVSHKHAKVAHRKAHLKTGATTPQEKPSPWVLRAASPDEAWVSQGSDGRNLQPVHIGDNLAGIGKVSVIQQFGDTWIVQGTMGALRQNP